MENQQAPCEVESTRLCGQCGDYRPIDEFRRRRRNGDRRHRDCNSCHLDYVKRRRKLQRRRDLSEFMRRVELTRSNPSKLEALTRTMISRFGGLEAFSDELMQWHRDAQAQGDLRSLSRFFAATLRLIQMSDQLAADRETPSSRMSDDELQSYVISEVKQLIRQEPAVASWVAGELGQELTPPADL